MADTGHTLLLVDAMLWTTAKPAGTSLTIDIHAPGPATGVPLIITERIVIAALMERRLSAEQAEKTGLLSFFGTSDTVARLRHVLHTAFPASSTRLQPAAQ